MLSAKATMVVVMSDVVPAHMGVMEWIACGFGVLGQGVCVWLAEIAIAGSESGLHQ